MTDLDDRIGTTAAAPTPWRPFAESPILTPQMTLGWEATAAADRQRLSEYLSALVAARRSPVHVNVAFNAAYFGYDLTASGYVGGPLELSAFPHVQLGDTTEALPVGAMVDITAGDQSLFAEVVYKEGAHPELSADGDVPGWLSGAPAGATGPGTASTGEDGPVLTERLVVDHDAFGADFSVTSAQLDRMRRRGRWLDANGHLIVDARYASRRDADLGESAFYAHYLLTRAREQLLSTAAPMPLTAALSDDAGEQQLIEALTGILNTIADALASLPDVRMWRGYATTRASFAVRLFDHGPLGGDDLRSVACGLARSALPTRQSRWAQDRTVTYTAVGPRLSAVNGAAPRLVGVDYATAVCHANLVIGDHARRDVDDTTGLLADEVHLRLDDPWQGGGIWRAEHPGSVYAQVDVTEPLGLGWSATLPSAAEETDPTPADEAVCPEPSTDELEPNEAAELTIIDSQLSWTQPLRLAHLLNGVLPVPEVVGAQMRDAGLAGTRMRLTLTHDGEFLDSSDAVQTVEADLFGHPRLSAVSWPIEFFAGIVVICTWAWGSSACRATTTLLDIPVAVDGMVIEHRYAPWILTRDMAPGQPRRGQADQSGELASLTLAQRVLRAVRSLGKLDPGGRAVLARTDLPSAVYGKVNATSDAELDLAVTELVDSGALRTETDPRARTIIIYEPRLADAPPHAAPPRRDGSALSPRFLRTQSVAGHLRRIEKRGQTATDEARQAYREHRSRLRLIGPDELPDGYTYVRPHSRGGR